MFALSSSRMTLIRNKGIYRDALLITGNVAYLRVFMREEKAQAEVFLIK